MNVNTSSIIAAVCASVLFSAHGYAGEIRGQARGLEGDVVTDVTITVLRSDGEALFNRTFQSGNYVIEIPDAQLLDLDRSVSVLFSAPGRDDARLDNVLGTANVDGLDMVLPLKFHAPVEKPEKPSCAKRKCRPRRFRRCR